MRTEDVASKVVEDKHVHVGSLDCDTNLCAREHNEPSAAGSNVAAGSDVIEDPDAAKDVIVVTGDCNNRIVQISQKTL